MLYWSLPLLLKQLLSFFLALRLFVWLIACLRWSYKPILIASVILLVFDLAYILAFPVILIASGVSALLGALPADPPLILGLMCFLAGLFGIIPAQSALREGDEDGVEKRISGAAMEYAY